MESEDDSVHERTGKRPRLFIKEMVMRNFKSYAGEQRVGPFHKVSTSTFSFCRDEKENLRSNYICVNIFDCLVKLWFCLVAEKKSRLY